MGQHAPARILAIFVAERSGSPRKSAIIYHLHLLSLIPMIAARER